MIRDAISRMGAVIRDDDRVMFLAASSNPAPSVAMAEAPLHGLPAAGTSAGMDGCLDGYNRVVVVVNSGCIRAINFHIRQGMEGGQLWPPLSNKLLIE